MNNMEKYTQTTAPGPSENLYDLSMLEEMDDNEYVLELLTILFSEAAKEIKEMKEALKAGKPDIVCKKAHKLKSSAGIIQADQFNSVLAEIETLAKNGTINIELSCLVENAARLYNNIERELKKYAAHLS